MNRLTGSVPRELTTLQNLRRLHVQKNRLTKMNTDETSEFAKAMPLCEVLF